MLRLNDLALFQRQVALWNARNFPDKKPHQPLLGVAEEVGELSHAHLKLEQGIRNDENLEAQRKDAVGDILVFLADYCNQTGVDMAEAVERAWGEVSLRDWRQYPDTKGLPPGHEVRWIDGEPHVLEKLNA